MESRAKDRTETERVILAAVTRIAETRGFSALGVNAVAQEAGVSKVLIYRYFGSYRGLLETWVARRNFWTSGSEAFERELEAASGDTSALAGALKRVLRAQVEELRGDRLSRELLRWFLAEEDAAAADAMARIEARGAALGATLASRPDVPEDFSALSALILAGVYYLALLSDRASVFNGVDIAGDEGWARLLSSVDALVDRTLPI